MTDEEEEYITLFCEGDGSVFMTIDGYPKVSFAQKERDVLDYVASLTVGGHINPHGAGNWELTFIGKKCVLLLEVFSRHVVGRKFLDRLNVVLECVGMPLTVQHSLTFSGFVGFWDAEGSSDDSPSVNIGQVNREILDLIAEMFGGSVYLKSDGAHVWHLGGEKARGLYESILERSRCPLRAEELRMHFEEGRDKCHKLYRDTHKTEQRVHNEKSDAKRRAVREWMRTHPEEVAEFVRRGGAIS